MKAPTAEDAKSDAFVHPEMLRPGSVFAQRYLVVGCLGAGGMGAVYEVEDRRDGASRALKAMLPSLVQDVELRGRFELEARVSRKLACEQLVDVFDAGVDQDTGIPFLVMELLEGEDLEVRLTRDGALPRAQALEVLRLTALGLDVTHRAGIVHRDIKPGNLFLAHRAEDGVRVKVLDFGIAKMVADFTGAPTTRSLGTPLYMAPEQLRGAGDITGAADVYSLTQVAFAVLTGKAYWSHELRAAGNPHAFLLRMLAGVEEAPTLRAARLGVELPASFDAWFARGTHANPERRPASATALVEELSALLGDPTTNDALPSEPSVQPLPTSRGSRRWIVATVSSIAVVVGLVSLWFGTRERNPSRTSAASVVAEGMGGIASQVLQLATAKWQVPALTITIQRAVEPSSATAMSRAAEPSVAMAIQNEAEPSTPVIGSHRDVRAAPTVVGPGPTRARGPSDPRPDATGASYDPTDIR